MQPDNIGRNLGQLILSNDILNCYDVVGFKEKLTRKDIMNGYSEKNLNVL